MKMKKNKADTTFWDKRRGKISSSKGGWQAGKDAIAHGYSLINDLIGNITYMQMIILNATGRLVEKRLADWFEGHFIGLSYADSRIWANCIGALGGTTRTSVVAATAAGTLGADSRAYGGSKTSIAGMKFIQDALKTYKNGESIEDILSKVKKRNGRPIITGFVRPVNGKDERIPPTEKLTAKLGFQIGEHLSLAYKLGKYLEDHFGAGMNIGGYVYGFLSDLGFTGEELYRIRAFVVASGITACFVDTCEKPEDSFLPLRCDDIEYNGHPPRDLLKM